MSQRQDPQSDPQPPPQGSAEYLALKLTGPDFGCEHTDRRLSPPGPKDAIPSRLGFFPANYIRGDYLTYLDTEKVCADCFEDVLPNGFLTWTAYYMKPKRNVYRSDFEYPENEPPETGLDYFSPQVQAGTEGFFKPKCYKGQNWCRRPVSLPANDDTRLVWYFMEWAKQPFYIDLLHLNPPWEVKKSKEAQDVENKRVSRANTPAYYGARYVISAVPEGGDGPYTVSEHRKALVGSYRIVPLTQYGDQIREISQIQSTIAETASGNAYNVPRNQKVCEVDPRFCPGQPKEAFKNPNFLFYPPLELVDRLQIEEDGIVLPRGTDEDNRHFYFNALPAEPRGFNLPPEFEDVSPRPDVRTGDPLPRIGDIQRIDWSDENAWRIQHGYDFEILERAQERRDVQISCERPFEPIDSIERPSSWVVNASGYLVNRLSGVSHTWLGCVKPPYRSSIPRDMTEELSQSAQNEEVKEQQ